MTPRLSVVMSAFNSSGTIERAISSVLGQSFFDFELIVLNDGSTDDTESKIFSFSDDRIKYHSLDHAGLTKALNFGVSQAEGEIIVRHDSDDWSESERFAIQLESFDADSELSLVASWHNVVDSEGSYLGHKETPADDADLKKMLRWRNAFCHGSVSVRKSALEMVGGYNESLLFSQDYDLWLRMAENGLKFSCIQSTLYNYSITPDSIAKGWHKLGYAENIRQNVLQPEHLRSYAVGELPVLGKKKTDSLWYYALGSLALDEGHHRQALSHFVRSLLENPFQWHAAAKLGAAILPTRVVNFIFDNAKERLGRK